MALFPATSRHGSVGLPLQHEVSSASEMPTSGSSNASPTCMTNWAAVSNNNNANNSKVHCMFQFEETESYKF